MSDNGFPKPVPELSQRDMKLLDGTYIGDYSFVCNLNLNSKFYLFNLRGKITNCAVQESAIENLLDPTHLQFVHEGQQGDVIGPRNVNYPDGT